MIWLIEFILSETLFPFIYNDNMSKPIIATNGMCMFGRFLTH